jgi:hypothetical protein
MGAGPDTQTPTRSPSLSPKAPESTGHSFIEATSTLKYVVLGLGPRPSSPAVRSQASHRLWRRVGVRDRVPGSLVIPRPAGVVLVRLPQIARIVHVGAAVGVDAQRRDSTVPGAGLGTETVAVQVGLATVKLTAARAAGCGG